MRDALTLAVGPDAGLPALLHPGLGVAWWWTLDGPAWHDGERLWVRRGARVLVLPLAGAPDVEPLPEGGLVAWTTEGEVVHVPRTGPPTRLHGPPDAAGAPVRVRNGADLRAWSRRGEGWRVQAAGADLPLPEGASRARDLRPYRRGEGFAWRSDGWLYRMTHRHAPRAVCELQATQAFTTGPDGALLVGDDSAWDRAAPARGHLRPLPVPLARTPWGQRWRADGGAVAGVTLEGRAVCIDLRDGAIVHDQPHARPLDAAGRFLGLDGTLSVGVDLGWRPREASCALRGARLAGPAGVVWDLDTGRRLFERPCVRFGVTVPTDDAWLSADWETGYGVRFDPETGRVIEPMHVPVLADDVLTRGWGDGVRAIVESAEGRQHVVEAGRVAPPASRVKAPPREPAPRLPRDLPVTDATVRGGRRVAWSDDGLLVLLPID